MPHILNDIAIVMPEEVTLAVVIGGYSITRRVDQRHTGFLIRGDHGEMLLVDLAWHNDFRCTPVKPDYAYVVVPRLDEIASATIIGFLGALQVDTQGGIPYSISYEDVDYFQGTRYTQTAPGQGLTCATFVIEVLRHHGIDMIAKNTWPITAATQQWQHWLVGNFPPTSHEFLEQCKHIGKVARFKPEEAVGVAYKFEGEQLSFADADALASEVVFELTQLVKDWPSSLVTHWFQTGSHCAWLPRHS